MGRAEGAPRRVLHVVGGLHAGGVETWLAQAVPAMTAADWEVEFCLLDERQGPLAEEFRREGYRVRVCSLRPRWSFPLRFWRLLKAGRYGVVHAHVLLFSGAVAAIARAAGVPVRLAHAHNSHDGRGSGCMRRGYRAAMRGMIRRFSTRRFACSSDAEAFVGGDAERLHYGVDVELFRNPQELMRRADWGIPCRARVIGHVGRLTEQKNQRFLLEAFADAALGDDSLHLAIAGEGELHRSLEGCARDLGIAERVHFWGRRTDVPALMRGLFDGFLMPSLHEGLPVALLEAQAAGLPCLISDRVGVEACLLPELIERIPLEAARGRWAHAVRRLARRGRLPGREAVRRMTRAGFDSRTSGAHLLSVYERAWRATAP